MLKICMIIVFTFHTALFSLEVVGNFENVDIEEFETINIPAKIDTGAVFSAIHCSYIQNISNEMVEFSPLGSTKLFQKKIENIVTIKSSNGISEKRFVIKTIIKLNHTSYPIFFSLTNRDFMEYKVLLGTNFIKNRFLIDVGKQILKD